MRNDMQMVVKLPAALKAELANKVLPVAATGPVSAKSLGGVPTVAEAGVPGYEVKSWNALYAPAATPKVDIDVNNAELRGCRTPGAPARRRARHRHARRTAHRDGRADARRWSTNGAR